VLGLIGRNGAGTDDAAEDFVADYAANHRLGGDHGRVGSLLEVGTGFHPELTGGRTLFSPARSWGWAKRRSIRKFDEIVAFAELEKFI